jgi:hypothetical protein
VPMASPGSSSRISARREGLTARSLPPRAAPFNHYGKPSSRPAAHLNFIAKPARRSFRVPSYWHQMNRAAYRRPRRLTAHLQCVRGRASRSECLHLHHPHAHERPAPPPAAPLFQAVSRTSSFCDSKSLTLIGLIRSISDSFLTSFSRGSIESPTGSCWLGQQHAEYRRGQAAARAILFLRGASRPTSSMFWARARHWEVGCEA